MQSVDLVAEAVKSQPAIAAPAITALALVLLALLPQYLREFRFWVEWFYPAAGPHTEVRVSVDP